MKKTITTTSAQETFEMGKKLGNAIKTGTRIALNGELGTGKTTFVQGVAKGLKVPDSYYITSPTFNIINEYPAGELTLCHLDLYRLGSYDELEYVGFEDLLDDGHVIIIEWPRLLDDISFKFDLEIDFSLDKNFNHILSFFASGQGVANLINRIIL